jgi:cell division protein ZipA
MSAVDDAESTLRARSAGGKKAAARSKAGAAGKGGKKSRVAAKADGAEGDAGSPDVNTTAEAEVQSPAPEEDLAPQNLDWLDDLAGEETRARRAGGDRGGDAGKLPRGVEPEVFMLNVVSRSPEGFSGEDILHILLACDLRFGDMDFFHRHENEAGRGAIQFSVANMMQPGVFNLDTMAEFNTPGLVFFVTLPGPEDMMKAFDYMLETARVVARNLDGDVLDESRSVVTRQTLEHSRQKIRDLERRMLARASHQ